MLSKATFTSKWQVPHNLQLLVAASGGIDSMCLIHLLQSLSINFSVAHVNFHLRGEESTRDELFLSQYCQQNHIPFYIHHADLLKTPSNTTNIQELARNVRYNWFEKLRKEHSFDFVLTAHHADDQMETLLLNLTRGTGIAGMRGIAKLEATVYRPLLPFTRKEIEQYVQLNRIPFIVDSSNLSDKYSRNQIRHHVLPELNKVNPKAVQHFYQFSELANFYHEIVQELLVTFKNKYFSKGSKESILDFTALTDSKFLSFYIYECIWEFGFNRTDCESICNKFPFKTSNKYTSSTHQLITQGHKLYITPLTEGYPEEPTTLDIQLNPEIKFNGMTLLFEISDAASITNFKVASKIFINYDLIESSILTLASIKPGDRFTPFGMKGRKKINDYFTDKKVALHHRTKACILSSSKSIIAVLPHEVDQAYAVNQNCNRILIVHIN